MPFDPTISSKELLDALFQRFNNTAFIEKDPVSIPHRFQLKEDIEIGAFFAAIFSWGNRTTILNKCNELLDCMDNAPFQFIKGHTENELKKLVFFKHRTFQATDLLHFIRFLRFHYSEYSSLESAFTNGMQASDQNIQQALSHFHRYFFSLDESPARTKKHIPSPENNSSCKRLNMFLRWMVRKDSSGIDFGIWKNILPSQLVCPLDIHVMRVAKELKLIDQEKSDWKTAIALTDMLKTFDPLDPVKYDIALFGWGVSKLPY
ncbi:MAG: hypothetical protein RLY11_458 [Bacteroidota bacterium]|jgi:uncharacterized protein (TIGR02757 family)|nr:TIGR02757 family protein [Chitinophagia bacterium]